METSHQVKDSQQQLREGVATLFKDSFGYLLGGAGVGLINFALVPLYTSYLRPAEFGVFILIEIGLLVVISASQLGFNTSYLKWFSGMQPADHGSLLGSTLVSTLLSSATNGIVLSLTIVWVAGGVYASVLPGSIAWMVTPIVITEVIHGAFLSDFRAKRRIFAYSSTSILKSTVILGCSYYLIAIRGGGIGEVFAARLIGSSVGLLLSWVIGSKGLKFRPNLSLIRPMIKYGLPLVWSSFMAMAMDATGRFILQKESSLYEVGLFGAALKVSGIFQMGITQPFGVAWGGLMFRILKWHRPAQVYATMWVLVFTLSLTAAFFLSMLTPLLFRMFTAEAYWPATTIFPLIVLVRAISVMEYPAAIGIYLSGRTGFFALIYGVGALLCIVTNITLTPTFGANGTAWSWLIGWSSIIIGMVVIGHRLYPLAISWKWVSVVLVAWTLVLLLNETTVDIFDSRNWALKTITACVVTAVVFLYFLHHFRSRKE
ncbi:MAG: polysaccharide biosynthesis protein [Cyclobacteriaceae bacterium]|nr:polysaccharide biosynthesis protein [Cyclobacteriaceae bacterium]